jgi:hypothetical protein
MSSAAASEATTSATSRASTPFCSRRWLPPTASAKRCAPCGCSYPGPWIAGELALDDQAAPPCTSVAALLARAPRRRFEPVAACASTGCASTGTV